MSDLPISVSERFELALEELTAKLKTDKNILAAILFGSLSYDTVWEKSDIDLMLVSKEVKATGNQEPENANFELIEFDVNIHVFLKTRSNFKRMIEGTLASSFIHSSFSKSRLLFTQDESIREWYNGIHLLGARDKQIQLMQMGSAVLPILYKAEKFCHIKKDPHYSFLWISYMYPALAKIETWLHDEIAGREVIHQALKFNPVFFKQIYSDLIDQPKTLPLISQTLISITKYLTEKIPILFQPLLDFLAEEGTIKSATEIKNWANREMNTDAIIPACEWLADLGIIHKVSNPIRLTVKSLVEMEELAFYYEN